VGINTYGTFEHIIDAKGRLFIPSRLRDDLGSVFYVTLSTQACLWAFSTDAWERIEEKVKAMPLSKQIKMRPLFSHATKCERDGQGRILLTQVQRDHAALKKSVTVVGAGERVEIWDSETWAAIDAVETTPENMEQVFTELDF